MVSLKKMKRSTLSTIFGKVPERKESLVCEFEGFGKVFLEGSSGLEVIKAGESSTVGIWGNRFRVILDHLGGDGLKKMVSRKCVIWAFGRPRYLMRHTLPILNSSLASLLFEHLLNHTIAT